MDATNHIIEEGSRYALREMRYGDIATLQVTTRGGEKRREVVDLVSQTDVSEVSDLYPGYKMSTRTTTPTGATRYIRESLPIEKAAETVKALRKS